MSSWFGTGVGASGWFAGGGGGFIKNGSGGAGGQGGGGAGGDRYDGEGAGGVAGTDGTGGGSGGAYYYNAKKGGSGIVLIRWLTADLGTCSVTGTGNTITTFGNYSVAKFIVAGDWVCVAASSPIAKVNGVSYSAISKVNTVAKGSINYINGVKTT